MPIQPVVGAGQEAQLGFKSLQLSPQRERILLLGQPSAGKTTCALTASTKFDPAKRGDGVVIDDICVITADSAALSFARALGYEFAYWLDLSEHLGKTVTEFGKVAKQMFEMANKLAKAGKIHTVIFDNISTVDAYWGGELARNFEGWALGERLNMEHKTLMLERVLPTVCNVILIAHTKVMSKADDEKRATLGLEREDRLVMDVSAWNGPKMYRAQTTIRLPVKRISGKGVKEDTYSLYPRGVDGIEAGCRHPALLAHEKLPASMQAVFQIIKEGAGAVVSRA